METQDLNLARALKMLEHSNADDLIRMWRIFGSYNFGAPPEECYLGWWNI